MKTCRRCKTEKDESDFSFKNKSKGILRDLCKSCTKDDDKKYYLKDKRRESMRRAKSKSKEKLKDFLDEVKDKGECEKCGEARHYLLDFHHLTNKSFTISEAPSKCISLENLKLEVSKCVLLCANCHRELHYFEKLNCNSKVECHSDTVEVEISKFSSST